MDRIETQASGGCQCGAVRYHVTAVLDTSHICHCRMCQKAAGNFFAALIGVPRDAITWTRGEPATFNSSDKAARGFCRDCGTPLLYDYLESKHINLTTGSFDDPAQFPPKVQFGLEGPPALFRRACRSKPKGRPKKRWRPMSARSRRAIISTPTMTPTSGRADRRALANPLTCD